MPPALGGVEVPGVGDFGVFVGDIVDKVWMVTGPAI
jgi:hypothetical protein